MKEIDLASVLDDAENDLTNGIQQVIYTLNLLVKNTKDFTIKTFRPDKITAQAMLEYIAMEEGKIKENITILCGKEIERYFKWLDKYCEENACNQEQALQTIINGNI